MHSKKKKINAVKEEKNPQNEKKKIRLESLLLENLL